MSGRSDLSFDKQIDLEALLSTFAYTDFFGFTTTSYWPSAGGLATTS